VLLLLKYAIIKLGFKKGSLIFMLNKITKEVHLKKDCLQNLKDDSLPYPLKEEQEFYNIIEDLLNNTTVQQMRRFNQHAGVSCYEHCMQVAYYTYLICKKLNLDYISATRGAMLHDLFLYDWHTHKREDKKWSSFHAFKHPKVALQNASSIFQLNAIEQDVILNHMWPVTIKVPHYKETVIVTFADKLSATQETIRHIQNSLHTKKAYKYAYVFLSLIIFRIV
jgi:uncharacterized protein